MGTMVMVYAEGVTLEQYDQATKEIFGILQPKDLPDGLWSHAVVQAEKGIKIVDIWESKEKFEAFGAKLIPAMKHANIPKIQPKFYEVHNFFKA